MKAATYTVSWDNASGYDWDETFTSLASALRRYRSLRAPYKDLTVTDRDHGTRLVLSSKGDDNINKLGLRSMVW